jgi:ATP-dependent Clp protease ATP-binding subunit ClpX
MRVTPKDIKKYLDVYVIGQDQAKKALSVAAYNHNKRINLGGKLKKSNVLLIGPTGSGKTYMVTLLAKILRVKFIAVDATQFTSSGYAGRDVDEIIFELMSACNKNEAEAVKSIVYIDEIDKIRKKASSGGAPDVNGTEVQQALLKMIEGSEVSYASSGVKTDPHDKKLDTSNIMFICSGAFVGLEDPSSTSLVKFGMIPEFLGRFSTIAALNPLSASDLKSILIDAKGSILDSYKEWFDSEGIQLTISEDGLDCIVEKTLIKNVGARGLHGTIDEALLNAQFEAPSLVNKPLRLEITRHMVETGTPNWVYN